MIQNLCRSCKNYDSCDSAVTDEMYTTSCTFCSLYVAASMVKKDIVPVVRCKDCIYYSSGMNDSEKWEYCTSWFADTFSNGYCWKGEKSK